MSGSKGSTPILVALAFVGLVDATYLTYDHGAYHADPAAYGGGLCGADGGCSISRSSALSELPIPGARLGMPTALLALAFYVVFIVLTLMRQRGVSRSRALGSLALPGMQRLSHLLFALAVLSVCFSAVLLGYSIANASICKFCVILYVVNLGLLWATWRTLGTTLAVFFKDALSTAFSKTGLTAAALMIAFLAGGYFTYRGAVLAAKPRGPDFGGPPPATLAAATLEGRPTKGPQAGGLGTRLAHFVEFADFQCGHCKSAFKTLEEVVAERSDVRVTFMHFPLDQACNTLVDRPFHARACELAAMGECAHQQGRFFEVAGLLFEDHSKPELVDRIAKLGLDRTTFESCIDDASTLARVKADIDVGLANKLAGTPAVFLNGKQIGGSRPKEELLELIEAALDAAPSAPSDAPPAHSGPKNGAQP